MSADNCRACRFWRENVRHRDPNDPEWGFGRCHRRGPVIVEVMVKAVMEPCRYNEQVEPEIADPTMTAASLWPATSNSDWCGEFEQVAL